MGKWIMMPTDASSAQTVVESSPVETSVVDTSLLETQWAGRVVASAFVLLAAALSWVFAATAMIG
ncbi:hypothetical protein ASG84_16685 [Rhodococcus sp. Leaf278]|nr:hypothetical protein ASG84_16685 [Rhodococcus sp. Leaf278]